MHPSILKRATTPRPIPFPTRVSTGVEHSYVIANSECRRSYTKPFQSHQLKGVDTYVHLANDVYQRFMNSQSLPVWACRRLSSGVIGVVLNQHVVGFFSKRLPVIDLKDRRSIPRSYFQSLISSDDYEYLDDPVDIAGCERAVRVALFGYELRAGFSVVAGVAVGYQGSDAQKVIDVVYEAFSRGFSSSKN